MGEKTTISWTGPNGKTFNPWWGCEKVSPGCANCYAETMAKRTGHNVWGKSAERRIFGDKHWAEPLKWNEQALEQGERYKVFCASMADWAEDRRELDPEREKLFALVEATPNLDWLLLTKRPELAVKLAPERWRKGWPSNAWAMTSVENQAQAAKRIPALLQIPAQVRGLSVEPLLEEVTLGLAGTCPESWGLGYTTVGELLHWVIVGGESGPLYRDFDIKWAYKLQKECADAGVAFWMKQLGGFPYKKDHVSDFPLDLRTQEFPR